MNTRKNEIANIQSYVKDFPKFSHSFEEYVDIHATREQLYNCIYEMRKWPQYLPHVKLIDVVYDDGQYQDFFMDVLSPDGRIIKVQSMRNCKPEVIIFQQPVPPVFLSRHAGAWTFEQRDEHTCRLNAYHTWDTKVEAAKKHFSIKDNSSLEKHLETFLREHARFTIETWKKIIDEKRL